MNRSLIAIVMALLASCVATREAQPPAKHPGQSQPNEPQPVQGTPVEKRPYPWDHRPNYCFHLEEGRPTPWTCKTEGDWPHFREAALRSQELISSYAANYDLMERAEQEMGFSTERFPEGQYHFEAWALAFHYQFYGAPQYSGNIAQKWLDMEGDRGFGMLAKAYLQYGKAWQARNSDYSSDVSPEAWKLYEKNLQNAIVTLNEASPKLKQSGPWHILKLRVMYESSATAQERDAEFKAAIKAWPDCVAIYAVPMEFAGPKWGGKYEQMDAVAKLAVKKTKSTFGNTMYALLYAKLFTENRFETLQESNANWVRIKQGILDYQSHWTGTADTWKSFASLACQARDRDEAKRLYQLYDQAQAKESKAVPPDDNDACRQFAVSQN